MSVADNFVDRMQILQATVDSLATSAKREAYKQLKAKTIRQEEFDTAYEHVQKMTELAGTIAQATADFLAEDISVLLEQISNRTTELASRTDLISSASSFVDVVASLAGIAQCIATFAFSPSIDNAQNVLLAIEPFFPDSPSVPAPDVIS